MCAFLDMLAVSEGTSTDPDSDDGYNVIVGGALFIGYADHPRRLELPRLGISSTAAGRYQLLARYFDAYRKQLSLSDFLRSRRTASQSSRFASAARSTASTWVA